MKKTQCGGLCPVAGHPILPVYHTFDIFVVSE